MTRFYSTEQLGPRQALLPSGTLWCRDVAIARIGVQRYHVAELPELADSVTADSDGMFDVMRDADEVFAPNSMASFEGVPITMGHPSESVTPVNWRDLAIGHVANVRRGDDLLIADLLIHAQRGIRAIREHGFRGLSAGYDARYEPTGDGRLRQRDVIANHVALLGPNELARCGEQCRVGDALPSTNKGKPMDRLKMTDSELDALLAKWVPKRRPRTRTVDRPIATTADRAALLRDRERAQQAQLRGIAARNREFWSVHSNG